jgi:hypothetical protein
MDLAFRSAVGEMTAAPAGGGLCAHSLAIRPADPTDHLSAGHNHFVCRALKRWGFVADSGIDEVIQAFIEDDLKMQMQLV